jgi:hypothetical protein
MVKEMYSPPPASACRVPDLLTLRPNSQGMAVMVRDSAAARDGWIWTVIGWTGWTPDWPPPATNSPAFGGSARTPTERLPPCWLRGMPPESCYEAHVG